MIAAGLPASFERRIPAARGLSGGAKDETIPDKIEQRSS
jgi:hypothetical protein